MVFKMFKNGALPILEPAKEIIIKQTKVEGIPSSEQQKWHIQSVDGIRPVPVMQSITWLFDIYIYIYRYIYIYIYTYIYIVNAYHKPATLFRPEGWHEVLHIAKPAKSRYDIRISWRLAFICLLRCAVLADTPTSFHFKATFHAEARAKLWETPANSESKSVHGNS